MDTGSIMAFDYIMSIFEKGSFIIPYLFEEYSCDWKRCRKDLF